MSNPTITPSNLRLGICRVTYDGVDLGSTLNDVVVKPTFEKAPLHADQAGTTVLDNKISGIKIEVDTTLAEVGLKANWKVVFPHSELVGTSPQQVTFYNAIGAGDLANAKELILHPLELADADKSEDYLFYKVISTEVSEIHMSPKAQRGLKVVWTVLPDYTKTPALFFVHGDPAIGVTDATASTPSFSGTGGGTMAAPTVYNGVTVSETITATCVTESTGSGVFSVKGTVSGDLGLATVGSAFTPVTPNPAVVSFTISDGTPDFELNDVFTFNTVAANYL